MSTSIDTAFVKQFEREVHAAYQRMGSKLRGTVRTSNRVQGASVTFQKVGKGTAMTKSSGAMVPVMNLDHTVIEVPLEDYYAGDWVDKIIIGNKSYDVKRFFCFLYSFYDIVSAMILNAHYNTNNANDNAIHHRRAHARRTKDVCMINVEGTPHPVKDWSAGGVLFECDPRPYHPGQTVSMILRFKVEQEIEDVKIIGHVVRANQKGVAVQFADLPDSAMDSFEKVMSTNAA